MILGMSTAVFTLLHVALSLIGIAAGLVAILALMGGRLLRLITPLFLITTVLTSLTGFLFPNKTITPGIALGILSMIALVLAIVALYGGSSPVPGAGPILSPPASLSTSMFSSCLLNFSPRCLR